MTNSWQTLLQAVEVNHTLTGIDKIKKDIQVTETKIDMIRTGIKYQMIQPNEETMACINELLAKKTN